MNSNLRHWSPFGSDNFLPKFFKWQINNFLYNLANKNDNNYVGKYLDHRNMETFCIKGLRNSKNSETRLF